MRFLEKPLGYEFLLSCMGFNQPSKRGCWCPCDRSTAQQHVASASKLLRVLGTHSVAQQSTLMVHNMDLLF